MIIFKAKWRPVYDSNYCQRFCGGRKRNRRCGSALCQCRPLKSKSQYQELKIQYPNNYLAIYDSPLDTDLSSLLHYPSVVTSKEEFN